MTNQTYINDKIKKGIDGENNICNLIEEIKIYHKVIRNVYIYNGDEKTEIDIILITCFGIFIIESKNHNGLIVGNEEDKIWKHYYSKTDIYDTYNYINQNNRHIKFLSEYLKKNINDFKSYIVFSENTSFSIKSNPENVKILNINQLIGSLIDDMHKSDIIYSHEEIDKIYINLKYYCEHSNNEYLN